jgi:hypothetical protein
MEIINKSENWWLRLSLVLIVLIWLSSLSVMNRSVATERQILIDSVSYFKLQNDSLTDENFNLNVELGRHELTREEMFFKYKGLEKDYNNYLEHETE